MSDVRANIRRAILRLLLSVLSIERNLSDYVEFCFDFLLNISYFLKNYFRRRCKSNVNIKFILDTYNLQ